MSMRQQMASLAHGTAHEVVALREAARRIEDRVAGDPRTKADVAQLLADMVATRVRKAALFSQEVAGHA